MKKLDVVQMEKLNGSWDWGRCIGGASGAAILVTQTGVVGAATAVSGWGGLAVLAVAGAVGCVGAS